MSDADELVVRATAPDEYRAAADTMRAALFASPTRDDEWAKPGAVASWDDSDTLTAWDGDRCVGHAGAFRFHTVVPGGARLATAGVTRVGVLPTHTRRGLLRRMMEQLLHEGRERGQALASLRASEAVIYGRFGFAVAAHAAAVEITQARAALRSAPSTGGSLRLLGRDELLEVVPALYERIAFQRPGVVTRPEWMWQRYLFDAFDVESKEARHLVVHHGLDGDDGYVDYELTWKEEFGREAPGIVTVHDLWAATPAVEAALWQHLFELDLADVIRASERPVDDLIRWWLRDLRALRVVEVWDEQWVRLLDVDTALAARSYADAAPITVEVTDPMFPDNDGTWRIAAGGVERTDGPGELQAPIDGLSAAYLGGTSWAELAAAGRVQAADAVAVARADALFGSRPLPFCGTFF